MDNNVLDDFVIYFPDGRLLWRERSLDLYVKHDLAKLGVPNIDLWNEKNAGRPAFATPMANGKTAGNFFGKRLKADSVVWSLCSGVWPGFYIYHINGDNSDNRMENLSSIKTTDLLKNRLSLGLRSTDRIKPYEGSLWCFRGEKPLKSVDPRKSITPGELGSLHRYLNMIH